jgi:signal transduction histidine kinase
MLWQFPQTFSLALRLSIAFALSVAIVAVAYLSIQAILVQRFASFITESSLKGQTNDIAEAIEVDPVDGTVAVRLARANAEVFDAFFANLKYRVLDKNGRVVAASDGVRFHVAAVEHPIGERSFLIQVGRSDRFAELAQDAIAPAVNEAVGTIVAISIPVFCILSFLAVRSVLQPVRIASEAAKSVGQSNLSARLPSEGAPAEIRPLIVAFNDLLARLEIAFASQRRFFTNAAHELKTPIALLRGQLEGAADPVPAAALRDIDAIGRIVGQLLHIAEVSGGRALEIRPTAVGDIARQVVAFLSWRAEGVGVSLHVVCDNAEVEVPSDQGGLFVLLKNLVENAVDFSPEGATVCIEVGADLLAVEDQGPGVPVEEREKIFERFWRGAPTDRPGSGLGLAICFEVAAAHGWRIRCTQAASGGARFEVAFAPHDDCPVPSPPTERERT